MITLTLPYPLSVNRYWMPVKMKTHLAILPTKEGKAYRAEAAARCAAQGIRKPITGRVQIDLQLYPNRPQDWKTRQRKLGEAWHDTVMCIDLDNANKVVLDSLKGILIEDDKWVHRIVAERMEPDGEARVVVTITAMPVAQPQADLLGEAA